MKTLCKNVRIIDPVEKIDSSTDLLIEDGVIISIEKGLDAQFDKCIDFEGAICAPGFFDMHVHLREPGREDEETIISGSNAAAAGGFTGVACMPNTEPAIDSAEVVELINSKNRDCLVQVYPLGAATVNRKGEALSPMSELAEAGAVGFSDDGVAIKTSRILRTAMEYAKMLNLPVIDHCEDNSMCDGCMNEGANSTRFGLPPLPSISEYSIVMRDILMAEYTGAKLHIAHISTADAVKMVREAKAKGIKVTAEVTPHHFMLTDDALSGYDTNYKMSPPLRSNDDLTEILLGLKDGTIDCIATDHAPHSVEEKEAEFEHAPNGILGLETALGLGITYLVNKGVLTLEELILKLSHKPREILNIPQPKIKVGEVANLTIFSPNEKWIVDVSKFKSKSRNAPYHNMELTGKPLAVINRNKLFYNNEFSTI